MCDGVLIKKMKMPEGCYKCPFAKFSDRKNLYCIITETENSLHCLKPNERMVSCPLEEIPETPPTATGREVRFYCKFCGKTYYADTKPLYDEDFCFYYFSAKCPKCGGINETKYEGRLI